MRTVHEAVGDLWTLHAAGARVAITTGGLVSKKGVCAMPRGCARQARERFPGIERILGKMISLYGNHVHDLGNRIVSFPVENSPYENPDTRLIEQSCRELVDLVDRKGWDNIIVPRPGCGGGGLEWTDVSKILDRNFDDRFQITSQES